MRIEETRFFEHQALTREIISSGIEVHRALGPGLLESAYSQCMEYELGRRGLAVAREKSIGVRYKELEIKAAYRADMVVEGRVLVEVKSMEALLPIHSAQVLTYLKFACLNVGLLMNFNGATLREGIRRLVR